MNKQLIIMVYRINIDGMSRSQASEQIGSLLSLYKLSDDEELKNDYIIREIWLPVTNGNSDVKIIYPVPRYTTSPEINELADEISKRIKDDPDNVLKQHWEKFVRGLKLRNLS